MKKILVLALLFPLLVGCKDIVNKDRTLVLTAGFIFDHMQNEGEPVAELLFDQSYYTFSSDIELDKPLVAGDQLIITFDGKYNAVCAEIYPAQCTVKGKIKDYYVQETYIVEITREDDETSDIAQAVKRQYILDNEYVILDEEGRYTSLDEYNGDQLYLSYNRKEAEDNCHCPKGALCGPCPMYIAGIYAFNPRPAN